MIRCRPWPDWRPFWGLSLAGNQAPDNAGRRRAGLAADRRGASQRDQKRPGDKVGAMSSHENSQHIDQGQLLTVTDRRVDDARVIGAIGEVDISTGPNLQAALTSAIRTADVARVVLDLSAVTFLGSRGLVALVDAAGEAGRLGKLFRIAVGNQHAVYRVLEVTRLDKELAVYQTLDEALSAE